MKSTNGTQPPPRATQSASVAARQQRADGAQADADRAQQLAEVLHRQRDATGQELEAALRKVEEAQQTARDAIAQASVAEEKVIAARQRAEDQRAYAATMENPDTRKIWEQQADRAALAVEKVRAKAAAAKRWIEQANQSVD
ncbi:MAG: hypothetical protein HYY24_20540 [Verrucomicrobia bacterium]|nr:hypothetical protein [Verrucomicrobiota bacterium]